MKVRLVVVESASALLFYFQRDLLKQNAISQEECFRNHAECGEDR